MHLKLHCAVGEKSSSLLSCELGREILSVRRRRRNGSLKVVWSNPLCQKASKKWQLKGGVVYLVDFDSFAFERSSSIPTSFMTKLAKQ